MMTSALTGMATRPWRTAAVCLISLVAAAPLARSADDEIVDEATPDGSGSRQPHMIDLAANFDANVFEQRGNGWVIRGASGPRDAAAPRSPVLEKGRQVGLKRIERIESACRITPEQKRLLLLAMESDVRGFAAEIGAVRDRYAGRQVNMNDQAGQRE